MSDIEKIIEGLELIETVIPSYKHARRKGITDEEADAVVSWALKQVIIILEQLRRAMYSKENTTLEKAIAEFTEQLPLEEKLRLVREATRRIENI